MTTLGATQTTIEHLVNEMDDNDLRSVLRAPKGTIKVKVANWKNTTAKEFREALTVHCGTTVDMAGPSTGAG